MTATLAPQAPEGFLDHWTRRIRNLPKSQRITLAILAALTGMAIARELANANDLTSSGTVAATLRLSAPLICAGLAALWAERVGIVNIGIEGMMILGTWFGAYGAWKYGPWVGLLLGILGGSLGGMVHAVATVRFNVDHVISGVAINILAAGSTRFLAEQVFTPAGGSISQSPPQRSAIQSIDLPFITGGHIFGWKSPDVTGWFEQRHWFLISDAAAVVRGVGREVSLATLLVLALVPLSGWILWRTRFGLRLRSSGEAPYAASSLGVNIPPAALPGDGRQRRASPASAGHSLPSWPPTATAKDRPEVRGSSAWPAPSSATGDPSACWAAHCCSASQRRYDFATSRTFLRSSWSWRLR